MKVLTKKRIELGEGHIVQYTLFENKYIGGIWFYHWRSIEQNRFHTHAFNSIAVTLSGSYEEQVIKDGKIINKTVRKLFRPRFLPKNYCHRILSAKPNTWTMVIFSKWIPYWWEYFQDTKTWVKYTWGRKVVDKIKGDETTKLK